MADPTGQSKPREKCEQSWRGGGGKPEAFALPHERAIRIPVPQREWTTRGVGHADDRLELPGPAKENRQVDPSVPIDTSREIPEKDARHCNRVRRVRRTRIV